jgi:HEPN domain-containing protein
MLRPDRQEALARRWLAKARTDLALATVVLERGLAEMEGWAAAFHAQQAAEKALKAILIARGQEPPHIHSLRALQALMPADLRLRASVEELAELSQFATLTHYTLDPSGKDEPSWEEAEAAVVVAGRVLADVRAYLEIDQA